MSESPVKVKRRAVCVYFEIQQRDTELQDPIIPINPGQFCPTVILKVILRKMSPRPLSAVKRAKQYLEELWALWGVKKNYLNL